MLINVAEKYRHQGRDLGYGLYEQKAHMLTILRTERELVHMLSLFKAVNFS